MSDIRKTIVDRISDDIADLESLERARRHPRKASRNAGMQGLRAMFADAKPPLAD
jgi:hypothetical protein